MSRVLLTGAAGFIGGHVGEALIAAGHDVLGYDALLPSVHPEGPPPAGPVPLRVADVRDPDALRAALEGVEVVCHQAAKVGLGVDMADAAEYAGCNDLATAVLLATMTQLGVPALVLASSMVVYGEGRYQCDVHGEVSPLPRPEHDLAAGRFEPGCPFCHRPLTSGLVEEDARFDPRNTYAATKAAQEYLAAAWARATGGTAVALRYHNVYGARMPRDTPYAGVASLFRSAIARDEAPQVYEDGGQRRDFVHVTDIAQANVLALGAALAADRAGGLRAYNIGSGVPHTIGELAASLVEAAGAKPAQVTGRFRLGDVRHITASSQRARRELGYAPSMDFETGVAAFGSEPLRGG